MFAERGLDPKRGGSDPGVSGSRLPKETREEMHERHSERDPKP